MIEKVELERSETVCDPAGKAFGLVLDRNFLMVINSDWGDGAVDYDFFDSDGRAQEIYDQIKLRIQTEGDAQIYDETEGVVG